MPRDDSERVLTTGTVLSLCADAAFPASECRYSESAEASIDGRQLAVDGGRGNGTGAGAFPFP